MEHLLILLGFYTQQLPEGMTEDVGKHLLNGMEPSFFIAMLLFAIAGVAVQFLFDVIKSVNYDKRTEERFNWKQFFLVGGARMIGSFIVLVMAVLFFDEISSVLFNAVGGGNEVSIQLTGWSSFLLGLSIDSLIKIVLDLKNPGRFVKEVGKVVTKNGK
jgi:hypothetical protein